MLVLGLQGSPRKNGNTDHLLSLFMQEAQSLGAQTHVVNADQADIVPCKEYITCEKKGFCPIKDDMNGIYSLLREADLVILATPVFFYNATAQLKALIDRSQTLWARKYKLGLTDPGRASRKGLMLAVGATKGKNLFEGLHLTARYFFDAVGASYDEALTYWRIEHRGDMAAHPTVAADVRDCAQGLIGPLMERQRVLFLCRENACRSQMAAGFARYYAGDRIEAVCAGSEPADQVNPLMAEAMAEKGIDMGFRHPQSIEQGLAAGPPQAIVTMGCAEQCPLVPGAKRQDWDLPDPGQGDIDRMRQVRDDIQARVKQLIDNLST